MQNKLQTTTNRELFRNPSIPSVSIKEFGIETFGVLDVKNYFIPSKIESDYVFIENEENSKENNVRSFDDTKWNSIISNEENEEELSIKDKKNTEKAEE